MTKQQIDDQSKNAKRRIITLLQTGQFCTVGFYVSFGGEMDLMPLLSEPSLKQLRWALPVCEGEGDRAQLRFSEYKLGDPLVSGSYNIPVPSCPNWVVPEVLLVPCLGGNVKGYRLGYGAGWYDRTLAVASPRPMTIGALWDDALLITPFHESHDVPLDYLVTPSQTLSCNPEGRRANPAE